MPLPTDAFKSTIEREIKAVSEAHQIESLKLAGIEKEEAFLKTQLKECEEKLEELNQLTQESQEKLAEQDRALAEHQANYKSLVAQNFLIDDPYLELWFLSPSSTLDSPVKEHTDAILSILQSQKTSLTLEYEKKTRLKEARLQTLGFLLQALKNRPESETAIPFNDILRGIKGDRVFFQELLSLEFTSSLNHIRSLKYCYDNPKSLKSEDYKNALAALIATIGERIRAGEIPLTKLRTAYATKYDNITKVEELLQDVKKRSERRTFHKQTLQQNTPKIQELETQKSQLQTTLKKLIRAKDPSLAKNKLLLLFQESLHAMERLLLTDSQSLGAEDSKKVGYIAWEEWAQLHATQQALLQGCQELQKEDDSSFSALSQQLGSFNKALETYLFKALDTSFKQYTALFEELQGLTPLQTADGFYAFLNKEEELQAQLKILQSNIEAYSKLEPSPYFQEQIVSYKTQSAEAPQALTQLAKQASEQLAAQIKVYRDTIKKEANLDLESSLETLESAAAASPAFKTAQTHLDSMYASPCTLYSFLELKEDQIKKDIGNYREDLLKRQTFEYRHTFYKDTLLKKYPSILNLLDKKKIRAYLLSGHTTDLLNEIEVKRQGLDETLQTEAYLLTIELCTYKRQHNLFPIKEIIEVKKEVELEPALDGSSAPKLDESFGRQPFNSPIRILEAFKEKRSNYYPAMKGLYQQIKKMEEHATQLRREDRDRDADAFSLLSNALKEDINYFIAEHPEKEPDEEEVHAFRNLVLARVHTENNKLGNHNAQWKLTVLNWLLGPLSLLKAGYSYYKTGRCSFFFEKTQRQILLGEFKEKTELYADPNSL